MSDEINLCPFCGSKYVSVIVPVETEYQVQCGNCYASSSIESTAKKAIRAWNRRTPFDHIVAANKKVDDNPPLTLEELRGMGDELVWMEDWFTETEEKEGYGFERASDVLTFDGWRHITNYGKMWRAYRRKPEEG